MGGTVIIVGEGRVRIISGCGNLIIIEPPIKTRIRLRGLGFEIVGDPRQLGAEELFELGRGDGGEAEMLDVLLDELFEECFDEFE